MEVKGKMKQVIIVLFNNFETLDVFGPVEVLGCLNEEYNLVFTSMEGGTITSSHNVGVNTQSLGDINNADILFIPGGAGTRVEVANEILIQQLSRLADKAEYVLTVCTGSALFSKTNLLNGKKATSNKRAFSWVKEQNNKVNWVNEARWINDEKYYTSSGVSAGIDMTLCFVADRFGASVAEQISIRIEYAWNRDWHKDEFYRYYQ